MKPRVLIIDDDREFAKDLSVLLGGSFDVSMRTDGASCREALAGEDPHIVLLDLDLGEGESGFDLLPVIKKWDSDLPVIVLTKSDRPRDAVEAMRRGAYHYLVKEPDIEELRSLARNAAEELRLRRELLAAREELEKTRNRLIGESAPVRAMLQAIRRVAPTDAPVLITGESGTGKELVARRIVEESGRAKGPFVAVNCAAFPESLLESELFGHEAGAFTGATRTHRGRFEQASGGSLFLDEIGSMAPDVQAKLLRALQERVVYRVGGEEPVPFDTRIIAATNLDPEEQVRAGAFREDLYYRLNVYRIPVPPLRDRPEDVPLLVRYFAARFAVETNRRPPSITKEALEELVSYEWPGNVRELQSAVQRAIIDAPGDILDLHHFSFFLPEESAGLSYGEARKRVLESFKKRYLARALADSDGNVSEAARRTGIPRPSLQRMLREAGIRADRSGREREA